MTTPSVRLQSTRHAADSGDFSRPRPEALVRPAASGTGRDLLRQRPVPRQTGSRLQIERRQKDGLGLLPRVADPRRRQARHRANQVLGAALTLFGGAVVGCGLAYIHRGEAVHGALALLLGLILIAQGVWQVGRRERRDRRQGQL